ncbi:hypothetical protein ACFV2X_14930 [Streptomyces sp. NPDC059679]|uniref:hypothetical protein n=1 Tax=Streptomyces sp. NPDC059679 TaxID=3346903 RepID=UPI003682E38B
MKGDGVPRTELLLECLRALDSSARRASLFSAEMIAGQTAFPLIAPLCSLRPEIRADMSRARMARYVKPPAGGGLHSVLDGVFS